VTREKLARLLDDVAQGKTSPEEALEALREFPSSESSTATIDHQRAVRCGFPEVVFGEGKTTEQIVSIAERIIEAEEPLLVTRVAAEVGDVLVRRFPQGTYSRLGRTFSQPGPDPLPPARSVVVVCAGTSDLPVAEEAAQTAAALGAPVERVRDVGVAGLHRLLRHERLFREAAALVVVAGMEGALPSVVGGLTDRPVIAVPTSVGYGASFGGIAALLAMLNSCAAGVSVVNIDNGFGAGYAAVLIARLAAGPDEDADKP
jgi:NCAIR mutase (PurE)-related protein